MGLLTKLFGTRSEREIKKIQPMVDKILALEEEYKALINRLSRIEGQVRGIRKMVESDTYCTDILIQVSAVQAALNAFNRELLANHIRTCVADDIRNGKDETIDELVSTLQKVMK